MDERKNFNRMVMALRQEQNVSLGELCGGLCSETEIWRMEKGERQTDKKALQDRILARLGVSQETYESYVFWDEYEQWRGRQGILRSILTREIEQAQKKLTRYQEKYCPGCKKKLTGGELLKTKGSVKLERQFCMSMEAQILLLGGPKRYETVEEEQEAAWKKKITELLGDALLQTVSLSEDGWIQKQALSIHEMNLALEYAYYRQTDFVKRCREIWERIRQSGFDEICRVKILPKAAYLLCKVWKEQAGGEIGEQLCVRILNTCGEAIRLLRKTNRMYFLWELLTIQAEMLNRLTEIRQVTGKEKQAVALRQMYEETSEWIHVLEVLYEEYHVSRETSDFCYLYLEKEVYCIGEVVRIRRQMLGMTKKQLCENICTVRTLSRLERNEIRTQREILGKFFERLKLAPDFCRAELITDDLDAKKMMDELRNNLNQNNYKRAKMIIKQIEELVSTKIPLNNQVILRCKALAEKDEDLLKEEEYLRRVWEALECSLPKEVILADGEKYMTNEEISCIHNIISGIKGMSKTKKRLIDIIYEIYRPYEMQGLIVSFINMYEMVMGNLASEWGNTGEYDRSNKVSRRILTECLRIRRGHSLHDAIYNICWNDEQRRKEDILSGRKQEPKKSLETCIILCSLYYNHYSEKFYRRKLTDKLGE